jgi:hypothetical protein
MLSDTNAACVAIAVALRLNMLSDSDDACVATALAVFKREKESPLDQGMVQMKTIIHTHENLMT